MLRYIIGITLITIGIIIVRALANGRVLKKHQYAFWLVVPNIPHLKTTAHYVAHIAQTAVEGIQPGRLIVNIDVPVTAGLPLILRHEEFSV